MSNIKKSLIELRSLWILIILCVAMWIATPHFLTAQNISNVLLEVAVTAVLAIGQTYIIILGEIDLSVGAILGLTGALSAGVLAHGNLAEALLIALVIGAAAGFLNGTLVTKGKIPSFIATLGTMTAIEGVTLVYTGGNPISVGSAQYQWLGQGYIVGIPVPVVLMVVLYVAFWFLLHRTHFGRYVFATGDNIEASRLSGINVRRIKTTVFMMAGALSAVAGIILTGRLSTASPVAGQGMELDSIAAVILGGTSLTGGKGRLTGTVIGAIILGVLDDGMNLLDVSAFYQGVVKGVIIILAVLLDNNMDGITGSFKKMIRRNKVESPAR